MDKIIIATFLSHEKEENRIRLLRAVRQSLAKIDDPQRTVIIEVSLHFTTRGDQFQTKEALKILQNIGKHSPVAVKSFAYEINWHDVAAGLWQSKEVLAATQGHISHETSPDKICIAFECVLEVVGSEDPLYTILMEAFQSELMRLLHNVTDHAICVVICKFAIAHPECIDASRRYPVCSLIMNNMRYFSLESKTTTDSTQFIENVQHVVELVQVLWSKQSSIILPFLKELFMLISSSENGEPSFALAAIMRIIPEAMISEIIQKLIHESDVSDDNMVTALRRMVKWLCWPTANMVPRWIVAFLCAFSEACKFSILIDVIYGNVKDVFECLRYPIIRDSALYVLVYMLLGYQHSPDAFHLVVPMLPELIGQIKAEQPSDSQKSCLKQLSNLCHCLMFHFSGFPELYEEILKSIEEFPKPTEDEIRNAIQEASGLNSQAYSAHQYVCDVTTLQLRSGITGRAGLINLGNTCYANCVIQALYYSHHFRSRISTNALHYPPNSLHRHLEVTFGFLTLSDRQAYKPEKLIDASRPDWFEKGMQQDSSEYLKFLLDKLHEEEIEFGKKKRAVASDSCDVVECDSPGPSSHSGDSQALSTTSGSTVKLCSDTKTKLKSNLLNMDSRLKTASCLFSGTQKIEIECHKCGRTSINTEPFVDISLPLRSDPIPMEAAGGLKAGALPQSGPFPKMGPSIVMQETAPSSVEMEIDQKQDAAQSSMNRHKFTDLLGSYLEKEVLEGDNSYQCHACNSLQKASKVISFSRLPDHLLFTLMRFTYDRQKQCRAKILDTVDIERNIEIEVMDENNVKQMIKYRLWAVIIHSGSSAESGHYYCYAIPTEKAENANEDWYLLNDNHVSSTNFENIQNLSSSFPRDTAYMVMYSRCNESGSKTPDVADSIRPEIRQIVQKDNQSFLKERELESKRKAVEAKLKPVGTFNSTWEKRDDDDIGPCGGSSGGGLDLTGSRLIF